MTCRRVRPGLRVGHNQGRGFTLIELLTIILIIAIVSSIVVPRYAQFWAKARFDGGVQQAVDLLAYAHEQAITNDTTVIVTFDQKSQLLTAMVTPQTPITDLPVALQSGASDQLTTTPPTPKGLAFAEELGISSFTSGGGSSSGNGSSSIQFRPDGTCDGASMTIVSTHGYSTHLILWPATSRVTQEDAE